MSHLRVFESDDWQHTQQQQQHLSFHTRIEICLAVAAEGNRLHEAVD